MTPRDVFVEAHGLRHHLLEWDGGGETTVLFLHGFLDLAWTWSFCVEALPPDCRWHMLALDWRGHGESDRVGAGGYYHFADYVRDLDALARRLRRGRLVLVGHSMGAAVATLFCGARPEAVERLVLVEGLGALPVEPHEVPERFVRWLDETSPFDPARFERPLVDEADAIRRLQRTNPHLTLERAERLAARGTYRDGQGRLLWRHDPLHRTRSPAPIMPPVVEAFWRRVTCPTLWVGGAESPWLGPDLDRQLAWLQRMTRKTLPEAGHMVQIDAPVALAGLLSEFIGP